MLTLFIYLTNFHWVKLLSLLKTHVMKKKLWKKMALKILNVSNLAISIPAFTLCSWPYGLFHFCCLLSNLANTTLIKNSRDLKKYHGAWLNHIHFRLVYWGWGRRRWLSQYLWPRGSLYLPPHFCTKKMIIFLFKYFWIFNCLNKIIVQKRKDWN